ncbi:hypothetical protein [Paraglaciecola sp. MB-3u-78]|uniref:hypothetical protein n=1 Tax=Paraglaciecola sp. MB-3u-78 TaxID=2058332 RepID=UPI000C339E2B|nr:hypothetical protein [Paraglaciecola sp. MB-3u-78]PKG93371.1 hypothetical protein CXF95_27800 [Paraglaciecola sp. MB-3u-78]
MTFSLGLFSHYPITASVSMLLLMIGLMISCYFAKQRLKHKRIRLAGVLVVNTVAALMVVGLAFDIHIISNQASVTYLVTKGTTPQQLNKIDREQSVFVLREAVKSIDDHNILDVATLLDVPSQLLSHQPRFDNLHVLGDGLSLTQWQDLQLLMDEAFANISVTFTPSKPAVGLVNMQWSKESVVGQFIEVQGQLQGTGDPAADTIYQLSLLDPVGEIVDTIRLKAAERFTLSFPAKITGQWVYRLQLYKSGDTTLLADEPIAFSVTQPAPVKILIKQSAPSFETRQLKNWAAALGSQIRVLTQISQNKDIQQNINLNTETLPHITPVFSKQTLAYFDWLLIDGRALLSLPVKQMHALQTAIKNGLGVYIVADNELVNAWPVASLNWLLDIHIQPLDVANYSAIPNWPHSNIEQAIPLVKATITSAESSYLVQNNEARILVSRSKIGLGQVAVSLINATYGWQTSGLTEQYSHYWQNVIYSLARPKQPPYWLNTQSDTLLLVNQAVQRCLLGGSASGIATHNQNTQPTILTEDFLPTEQQCLTIWPANEGWHKLAWWKNRGLANSQHDQSSLINTWLYAHAEEDWPVWQQTQKQHASQNMAKQHNPKQFNKQSVKSLDKDWFWGLLVVSMSMLWLERKLF